MLWLQQALEGGGEVVALEYGLVVVTKCEGRVCADLMCVRGALIGVGVPLVSRGRGVATAVFDSFLTGCA